MKGRPECKGQPRADTDWSHVRQHRTNNEAQERDDHEDNDQMVQFEHAFTFLVVGSCWLVDMPDKKRYSHKIAWLSMHQIKMEKKKIDSAVWKSITCFVVFSPSYQYVWAK